MNLKERRIAALHDVARAASAFADFIEQGGEVPYHMDRGPYAQAVDRAWEQLRNAPGEVAPCDCTIPDGWDETELLAPKPNCPHCKGSGEMDWWTPALDSSPVLFEEDSQ